MSDSDKTDAKWRRQLTPDEYRICRQQGTERAFSGEYCDTKTPGRYHCICCDAPLFDSDAKYDSGSGWPSFYQPLDPCGVDNKVDTSHAMVRNEVHCARCGSHLGHVFDDGPRPTGQRFCINSVSLKLRRSDG
jgi:peptide-methionine (R)-S-oxide reductase